MARSDWSDVRERLARLAIDPEADKVSGREAARATGGILSRR